MKKSSIIILIIICIIVAATIGGGITYFLMESNKNVQTTHANSIETEETASSTNENVNENNSNSIKENNSSSSYNSNTNSTNKKKRQYTHIALQGCVIIESNADTGACTYKKKCESCGYIESGNTTTYLTGATMNTSFCCPKCKETQKVQIETTSSYQ